MMGPQQVSSLSLAIGDKDGVGDQRNVRIKDKDNLLMKTLHVPNQGRRAAPSCANYYYYDLH